MESDQPGNLNAWQSGFCRELWIIDLLTNGHGDGEADGYCVVDSWDDECVGDGDGTGILEDNFDEGIFYIEDNF